MNDYNILKKKLEGCYVTIPTMFHDGDLEIDENAIKEHIVWLKGRGVNSENSVLLSGGAAGDFSTMSIEERFRVLDVVLEQAGDIPVALGGQTANTRELVRLAKAAEEKGASFLQVSPPYYFNHTEDDFYEFISAAAEVAPHVGIIIYNTFWTSRDVSFEMVEKLKKIPNVVGLKWATPRTDAMEFETVCTSFSDRFTIIDNNLLFGCSFMMGARAIEVHVCNYWPEKGLEMLSQLQNKEYEKVQRSLVENIMPFYHLWVKIEKEYTSGDGYLDKLCMELVGLKSSRCRPPTRDIRSVYREQTREMLIKSGVPGVKSN